MVKLTPIWSTPVKRFAGVVFAEMVITENDIVITLPCSGKSFFSSVAQSVKRFESVSQMGRSRRIGAQFLRIVAQATRHRQTTADFRLMSGASGRDARHRDWFNLPSKTDAAFEGGRSGGYETGERACLSL